MRCILVASLVLLVLLILRSLFLALTLHIMGGAAFTSPRRAELSRLARKTPERPPPIHPPSRPSCIRSSCIRSSIRPQKKTASVANGGRLQVAASSHSGTCHTQTKGKHRQLDEKMLAFVIWSNLVGGIFHIQHRTCGRGCCDGCS